MTRKAIPPKDLFEKSEKHFMDAVNGQSHLACALITTAFLENALMSLLTSFFVKGLSTVHTLMKPGNVLGDLSKLADVAYCLGFINTTMLDNIKLIGLIRNEFAHADEPIDFNHDDVTPYLDQLTFPKAQRSPKAEAHFLSLQNDNRAKFTYVAHRLFAYIISAALSVDHQQSPRLDGVFPPKIKDKKAENRR
jgi:DNA-binding MltR family transcriptional regulator